MIRKCKKTAYYNSTFALTMYVVQVCKTVRITDRLIAILHNFLYLLNGFNIQNV